TAPVSAAPLVHANALIGCVAVFGTGLRSVIPGSITGVPQLDVLPAVRGAATGQLASSLKNPRATIAALVVAAIVIFGLTPLFPVLASFDVAIAVFATIAVTWFTRKKTETGANDTPTRGPDERI